MASYKPSPLSFNSPRASPFRRPSSPTTAQRPSTPPNQSPGRNNHTTPTTSPSKLKQSYIADDDDSDLRTAAAPPSPTPPSRFPRSQTEPPPSPPMRSVANNPSTPMSARPRGAPVAANVDVLSKLPPQLLHSLREAFSVLDRDSDGQVDRSDVVDVFTSLGLDSSSTAIAPFFPPGSAQTMTLPAFLNALGIILMGLSPPQELLNAFAAFDDDDSGQVDVAELKDALVNTAPDSGVRGLTTRDVDTAIDGFTGRRTFGRGHSIALPGMKGMGNGMGIGGQKKGEVFRYSEFVGNITGGPSNTQAEAIKT